MVLSKQSLETLKQYKGLHPVLNKRVNIEYYPDPIFKEYQALEKEALEKETLKKEAFEKVTECMEEIIDKIPTISKNPSAEINLPQNLYHNNIIQPS